MRSRGFGRPWGQYFGLLLLAAGTVALIFLALTRNLGNDDADSATDPVSTPTASTSTSAPPSIDPSESPTDEPTTSPSLSTEPPTVPDQRRVDFTKGDKLPDGGRLVDGGGNSSGLVITNKGLTHGQPTSENFAAGILEVKLDSDVRALGVRVRFADENPGAVTLVGWQSSIAAVVDSGGDSAPQTGFRLVATPGEWTLSTLVDGVESTLAEGTYDAVGGPETFQILRDGAQVFVVDPTGAVTTATDPRVAELAGPWASWGVTESATNQTPAVIESVWGG